MAQQTLERATSDSPVLPPAPRSNLTGRLRRLPWPIILLAGVLAVLVVLPILVLFIASFVKDSSPGTFDGELTLDNYVRVFTAGSDVVINSLVIGFGGALFAIVIGCGLAWLETKTDVPFPGLIRICGVVPLFVSSLVGALAWSVLASPTQGYINILFESLGLGWTVDVYTVPGIVFVCGLYYAPYVFLLVRSALLLVNPELEEAAEVLGARRFTVSRTVTFKLVAGALLGSSILVLALILENFPIPSILGTPKQIDTVATVIYRLTMRYPSSPSVAAAYGIVLLIVLAAMLTLQNRVLSSRGRATLTGKGFRPRRISLGWTRWFAVAMALLYILAAVVLPLGAICIAAFHPNPFIPDIGALIDPASWSFKPIQDVLLNSAFSQGLMNSLIVCTAVAVGGGALYLIIAYLVHRTKYAGSTVLSQLAMWPIALPGLVIGLALLWVWVRVPGMYGTYAVLILGYICVFLPQGYQGMTSTIVQVHPELEESSSMLGAGRLRTVTRILMPLIRPGVGATVMLVFVLSMRELSVAIFLFTDQTEPLSIVIYNTWAAGTFASVAAMGLLYIGLLLVLVLLGRKSLGLGAVDYAGRESSRAAGALRFRSQSQNSPKELNRG